MWVRFRLLCCWLLSCALQILMCVVKQDWLGAAFSKKACGWPFYSCKMTGSCGQCSEGWHIIFGRGRKAGNAGQDTTYVAILSFEEWTLPRAKYRFWFPKCHFRIWHPCYNRLASAKSQYRITVSLHLKRNCIYLLLAVMLSREVETHWLSTREAPVTSGKGSSKYSCY